MSQYDPDLDNPDDGDDNRQVSLSRKDIRALEARGKAATDAEARAAQLERDNLFLRAGVDTATEKGGIFARGYDGELDVEKVKAAAQSFGLHDAPVAATDPPVADPAAPPAADPLLLPGEAGFTNERGTLGDGARSDTGIDPDPYARADEMGRKIMQDGGRELDAVGAGLNFLANQAAKGDQRVIIPGRSTAATGGGD